MSAPLLTRKKVLQVKVEGTKGTAEAAGLLDALVFDPLIQPTAEYIERKGTAKFLGHTSGGVLGEHSGVLTYSAELRGNGTNAMDPAIGAMLTACGFANAAEVYTPTSDPATMKTLTAILWEDGKKKILFGAMGNVEIVGDVGKRVMLNFEFLGKWTAPEDVALPAYTPSDETPPTFKAGTWTLNGAATYLIATFNLNMNNNVINRLDANDTTGIDWACITDRDPTVSFDPEQQLVADYDFEGKWLAETDTNAAIILAIGTGAGKAISISIPTPQFSDVPTGDREGIVTHDMTAKCNTSENSGNDEVSITVTTV